MRWFKHLTRAHKDETITPLLHRMGAEGYGYYWMVCEIVAESMDKSQRCSVTHPDMEWARMLATTRPKVRKLLGTLSELSLIKLEESSKGSSVYLTVEISKLLKYRDEYTKKSGETPDKLRTNSGQCQESVRSKDTDTDADIDIRPLLDFFGPDGTEDTWASDGKEAETGRKVSSITVGRKREPKRYSPLVESLAESLCARHPKRRRCTPGEAKSQLAKIFAMYSEPEHEALAARIDAQHAAQCRSFDWVKEDGQFAKALNNWLAPTKERWQETSQPQSPAPFRRLMRPAIPTDARPTQ